MCQNKAEIHSHRQRSGAVVLPPEVDLPLPKGGVFEVATRQPAVGADLFVAGP